MPVGVVVVLLGVATLVARILFVRSGILYGTAAVSHVDVIVGALVVIGLALIAWGWSGRKAQQGGDPGASPGSRWTDWASGVTALAGTAALVISLTKGLSPINP